MEFTVIWQQYKKFRMLSVRYYNMCTKYHEAPKREEGEEKKGSEAPQGTSNTVMCQENQER